MSLSAPFIRRPIGTLLMAIGLSLVGLAAYVGLPVANLPSVDLPVIRVSASRPGADPVTMAATVAAPLERRLGKIAGVEEVGSTSAFGQITITVHFDSTRDIDGAARDVQAALNAAAADLPGDLPTLPIFRKANPESTPFLVLALTSNNLTPQALYDAADSIIAQRISQLPGVGEVGINGSEQPAIRIRVDPRRLAAMGMSMEDIRSAIADANALGPAGSIEGEALGQSIGINDQLRRVQNFGQLLVKSANGIGVRLSALASIEEGTRNTRTAAWYNGKSAVILTVTKQRDANVIQTVDRVRELLPELRRWLPAGIDLAVLSDSTIAVRASVDDMQWTLVASIAMVMLVVFLFLRRTASTLAAGVTVPLALAGTFAAMWAVGFSLNNLSLMALAVSVGFVVDDAIVMIENIDRKLAQGMPPLRAALEGAREINFTVVAISLSLIAAFIPLLVIGGSIGRFFQEFAFTLAFAIVTSTIISLTLTPTVCAHWLRNAPHRPGIFDRRLEAAKHFYARTLPFALDHWVLTLLVMLGTVGLTVQLYRVTPKSLLPDESSGLLLGWTEAAEDISFQAMLGLQQKVTDVIRADPDVEGVSSMLGSAVWSGLNNGNMFIALKPAVQKSGNSRRIIERLRAPLAAIPGISTAIWPSQSVRFGSYSGRSEYELQMWSDSYEELVAQTQRVEDTVKAVPGVVDASAGRRTGALEARVVIDRGAADRLGVRMQDIDNALNNAFSQRQIATMYYPRNQYRVVLEVEPRFSRDPSDVTDIYVPAGKGGVQVPLSAVAHIERGYGQRVVNHKNAYPAASISFGLKEGASLEDALAGIRKGVGDLHLPESVKVDFGGDAQTFSRSANSQPLLILAALAIVYIVLGILYESLAHPLTIISTLPAAGLGALLALQATGASLSLIAFIGIILLIGIVKKNGIMLVDFALTAERQRGLSARDAIYEACLERFRPILMTTLSSALGAVPLIIATGNGADLRRPLGITIVGGLLVSQVLTLYTTPVIYLLLDRLHRRWSFRTAAGAPIVTPPSSAPAE